MKGALPYPDFASASASASARDVMTGRDPDILTNIHSPGIGAVIWARPLDPGFLTWIDGLPIECLPELKVVVPVDLVEAAVIAACEAAGTPAGETRDMLTGDIGALALIFSATLKVREVRIRLEVIRETMCPKFHVDAVKARLLCTYRGSGTEYVPEGAGSETRRVRQTGRGSAALFRGGLWPAGERTGLLHRSPEVTSDGQARFLLVIDPVEEERL